MLRVIRLVNSLRHTKHKVMSTRNLKYLLYQRLLEYKANACCQFLYLSYI